MNDLKEELRSFTEDNENEHYNHNDNDKEDTNRTLNETELGDGHLNQSKIELITNDDKGERLKAKQNTEISKRLNLNLNEVHAKLEEKNPILKQISVNSNKVENLN